MSNNLRDKLLIFQTRVKRDPEAFGKIYDAYVSRIYRFIYYKVPSVQEAEDLTSESFLRLWKYVQEGKPVKHLGALLYQISRNLVTDYYRSRPERLTSAVEDESQEPSAYPHGIEQIIERTNIERSLRLLKDEYREVIILRYLDELQPREIATVLGKSAGATRVTIHRALEALRSVVNNQKT